MLLRSFARGKNDATRRTHVCRYEARCGEGTVVAPQLRRVCAMKLQVLERVESLAADFVIF